MEAPSQAEPSPLIHGAVPVGDEVHCLVRYIDAVMVGTTGSGKAAEVIKDRAERHFEMLLEYWPDSCYAPEVEAWLSDLRFESLPSFVEFPDACQE